MTRYLMVLVAVVGLGTTAEAGGPPPVYVVVDKVVLEPSVDAPERIRIEGSFVRLENLDRHEYGKPVHGFVYLGVEAGKEKESRAEWATWRQAAGTGKAVAVGACRDGGAFLTVAIRKPDERVEKPDAAYVTGRLCRFGDLYAERSLAQETPVRALLAFVKARQQGAKP